MRRFLAALAAATCLTIVASPVAGAQSAARPQAGGICFALFNIGICFPG